MFFPRFLQKFTNSPNHQTTFKKRFIQYAVPKLNTQTNLWKGLLGGAVLLGGGYLLSHSSLNKPLVATPETSVQTTTTSLPQFVQEYLKNTYQYVALGSTITGASAYAAYKLGLAHRVVAMGPGMYLIAFAAGSIATLFLTRSISFNDSPVLKHISFTMYSSIMGLSLAPITFLSPAVLIRAGLYTLGVLVALSYTAMSAKEEQFLSLGGPLMIGLTIVCLSSIVNIFLPASYGRALQLTELIVIYGGLALFSLMLLYDTQVVMKHAYLYEERSRVSAGMAIPKMSSEDLLDAESAEGIVPHVHPGMKKLPQPDFINESLRIYLDVLNIFIRLVYILSGKQRERKR